ncbi:MAG: chromosomal replication initiator protein DnaA [bacterium]|nr:chromosomal replication initiator protein DnaA [bacterium]
MTKEELWQTVLSQLQFKISPANFATWLKNTHVLTKGDGSVVISVPNNFSKEWLENKYHKTILQILRSTDDSIKEAFYTVERSQPTQDPYHPLNSMGQSSSPQDSGDQLELQGVRIHKATNLNPRYVFDNFIVGPFNELAHAAAWAIVQNPGTIYNPLFVYGGVGLGKTHLLQATGNEINKEAPEKKIRYISSERFTSEVVTGIRNHTINAFRALYRDVDVLIIDDIQFLAGKEKTQEELFHTFNALHEKGKQVIFSSDRPPKAIPALEERLRSRFEGGMIADISLPDFETRMAILKVKTQERGSPVSDEICDYIASNIHRNVRELEGALNKIIAFWRLHNREPSLPDMKAMLKSVINNPNRQVTPKKILEAVSEFYDIKEKEMIASSRKREIVRPRQIAMYLFRQELKSSFPFIGKKFGGKDHTTAMYAFERISKEAQGSEMFQDELSLIRQRIYGG